jgi:hypothetical protein
MYHFVVPHVDSSMGISLLVWNELPIKVIVVPPDEDIPRLYVFENVEYVVASYEIWLVLVENNRNQPRSGNLYLAKPGEKLCPDIVEKFFHDINIYHLPFFLQAVPFFCPSIRFHSRNP